MEIILHKKSGVCDTKLIVDAVMVGSEMLQVLHQGNLLCEIKNDYNLSAQ